ncbi:hypothetical protein SynA1840_02711 [Synechococcus sp. A18-40]|nr:hypothetical protein SynA1840_02711 [Synechococcus sp. A18-40]
MGKHLFGIECCSDVEALDVLLRSADGYRRLPLTEEVWIKVVLIRWIDNNKLICSLITSATTLYAWNER